MKALSINSSTNAKQGALLNSRVLLIFLAICLCAGLFAFTPAKADARDLPGGLKIALADGSDEDKAAWNNLGDDNSDYKFEDNTLYIKSNTAMIISGATTSTNIEVMSGVIANLTLQDAQITSSDSSPALRLKNLETKLIISGSNTLSSAEGAAVVGENHGLYEFSLKDKDKDTLTITGGKSHAGVEIGQASLLNITGDGTINSIVRANDQFDVYGNATITSSNNFVLLNSQKLTVLEDATLILPDSAMLTNNGTITNNGTFTIDGVYSGTGNLINNGTVNGVNVGAPINALSAPINSATDTVDNEAATTPTDLGGGSVSPVSAIYDLASDGVNHREFDITLTISPGNSLAEHTDEGGYLIKDVDYAVSGDVFTFKSVWLDTLTPGTKTISFDLKYGTDPMIVLEVIDTSGQ